MLLLLKHMYNYNSISTSSLIIFFSIIGVIGLFYFKMCILILLLDIYIYSILEQYTITSSKTSTSCKIEIVAEGQKLAETNNLAKMVDHYGSKFIT